MTSVMHDFGDGIGPVPAHRHRNPDGDEGGWVADTATVAPTAYVGPEAQVYDNARVYGEARVGGRARVYGEARVYDNARVSSRILSGTAGGYSWDCYRVVGGALVLRYGCELHPLADWPGMVDAVCERRRDECEQRDPARQARYLRGIIALCEIAGENVAYDAGLEPKETTP